MRKPRKSAAPRHAQPDDAPLGAGVPALPQAVDGADARREAPMKDGPEDMPGVTVDLDRFALDRPGDTGDAAARPAAEEAAAELFSSAIADLERGDGAGRVAEADAQEETAAARPPRAVERKSAAKPAGQGESANREASRHAGRPGRVRARAGSHQDAQETPAAQDERAAVPEAQPARETRPAFLPPEVRRPAPTGLSPLTPALAVVPQLLLKAQGIRVAFFDVDGVLTDGGLFMGENGETFKRFNTLDGHGIKLLAKAGITPAVVTGRDSPALRHRLAALGITHVRYGTEDKRPAAEAILEELALSWTQAAWIGDDWPDLPAMRRCAFACAPANAHAEVKAQAHHVTQQAGGHGAAREFCDLLLVACGRYVDLLQEYAA